MLYKDLMDKLMLGQDLTRAELERTIAGIMTQELTQVQVLGFQMAFLMKGPTPQELADYAHAMRANCTSIDAASFGPALDIAATGAGERAGRLAPAVALLAAAPGAPVIKQVRTSVPGYFGSAGVLAALGIDVAGSEAEAKAQLAAAETAFLDPRAFHPSLAQTLNDETEAQIRALTQTIIGPLMNPAMISNLLFGVHDRETLEILQEAIPEIPGLRALLVQGADRADSITLDGPADLLRWDGTAWQAQTVTPAALGLRSCSWTLQKTEKDAETAAQITALLRGEVHDARRDVLLANVAAALWVSGQVERLADGVCLAATRLDRGDGARRLEALQALHRDAVREKG